MLDRHAEARATAAYFTQSREDLVAWLGNVKGRSVLDVGCGSGVLGAELRRRGASRVVGVELDPDAARVAATRLDEVFTGRIEEGVRALDEKFDIILCADVIEHLVDPWRALLDLHQVASTGCRFAVSIPNIRFAPALLQVAFGRGFHYEANGIFDSTHLRFFARPNIVELLSTTGWRPIRWGGPKIGRLRFARRAGSVLTRGWLDQWTYRQLFVEAVQSCESDHEDALTLGPAQR
jgi:2-polyprenyl-3-methyl-5-hydroxy-6-metoxy-1,4-benzoquinol methylase